MAAKAVEVVNTPEQISEYAEIYDYNGVDDRYKNEAKEWFGCFVKPSGVNRAYYKWRKWNDPNYTHYVVKKGNRPIVDKRTGELAISPSFEDNVTQKQYKKGMVKFQKLKIQYEAADNEEEEVIGMGALALEDSDDDEEGEVDDEEVTEAMAGVRVE